jgi:hypothetical protein
MLVEFLNNNPDAAERLSERFIAPVKKIVSVPKSEIQKREDLYRKQRSAKGGNKPR